MIDVAPRWPQGPEKVESMSCFYCDSLATAVCGRCGGPVCDAHSTEDDECYDDETDSPLHTELGVEEWITATCVE